MKLEYVFFCMIMINQNIDFGFYPSYGPVHSEKRRQDDYFNALIITSFNSKVRNPVEKS